MDSATESDESPLDRLTQTLEDAIKDAETSDEQLRTQVLQRHMDRALDFQRQALARTKALRKDLIIALNTSTPDLANTITKAVQHLDQTERLLLTLGGLLDCPLPPENLKDAHHLAKQSTQHARQAVMTLKTG
jgi:cysteinyl-tRNA synthetase